MIFDILGSGKGKNPFPGYELKVGELCSLPALTTNSANARVLNIPSGCIPVCIKMEPTFRAASGKGETSALVLDVRDNNGNILYRACRNGSGEIYNNGTAYLCPLGAYNGDLERAQTCSNIYVRAHNSGMEYLYSDYRYGKLTVTMWLEKIGGGRLNALKTLLLSHYSHFYKSVKTLKSEVSNMLFDIQGGSKKSTLPAGYELKFGSLAKAEIANVIPVAIKMSNYQHETSRTGETSYGSCTMYATGGNKTLLSDYTRMAGNWHLTEVSGGVFWLPAYFGTDGLHFEELKTITGFSGSPTIVAWLERTGGGR